MVDKIAILFKLRRLFCLFTDNSAVHFAVFIAAFIGTLFVLARDGQVEPVLSYPS